MSIKPRAGADLGWIRGLGSGRVSIVVFMYEMHDADVLNAICVIPNRWTFVCISVFPSPPHVRHGLWVDGGSYWLKKRLNPLHNNHVYLCRSNDGGAESMRLQ